jgi:hypothetical protein
MKYLVVIWVTGEKEVYSYNSKEDAEEAERGFWMAFGNQISWTGIR